VSASRERVEELAALVAAGGASTEEERELAELTAADPDAARAADEMIEAAALLAQALPPAAAPPRTAAAAPIDELARRRNRQVAGMAVVALVAAAAILLLWWRDHRGMNRELARARTENSALMVELLALQDAPRQAEAERRRADAMAAELAAAQQRAGIVASPRLQLATMHKDQSTVKVLIDPDGRRWLVLAFELPPAPGKDYQLWFVPAAPGAAPISAGLLRPGHGGLHEANLTLPADLPPLKAAAISLEKLGGAPAPTDVQMIGPI
jgi:hypothetical protein